MQVGFASHSGRRTSNQDNALFDMKQGIFAVADGVGGGSSGEEAAAIVCIELMQAHRRGQPLSQGILNGHQELRKLAKSLQRSRYCASTIASLGFFQRRAEVAWVGDSRVYLLRNGQLLQMTTDHSVEGQQHVLTQAIGAPLEHPLKVDLMEISRQEGDVWLLCSDGLYTVVDDEALLDCLASGLSAQAMANRLLDQALRQGADDNVTLLLVRDGNTASGLDKASNTQSATAVTARQSAQQTARQTEVGSAGLHRTATDRSRRPGRVLGLIAGLVLIALGVFFMAE